MYYQNKPPKEPSGCLQTIFITRAILAILMVPLAIIMGAIIFIMLAFYALTISPFLALFVIGLGAGLIISVAKWEARRVAKEAEQFKE